MWRHVDARVDWAGGVCKIARMESTHIQLGAEDRARVERLVAAGAYADPHAVVHAALVLLEAQMEDGEARKAQLRQMLQTALEGGEGRRTAQEILDEALHRPLPGNS